LPFLFFFFLMVSLHFPLVFLISYFSFFCVFGFEWRHKTHHHLRPPTPYFLCRARAGGCFSFQHPVFNNCFEFFPLPLI
jgi:hypothetical protein